MDVNSLLDEARKVCKASSDKELAPHLGVKPSAVSNYRKGVSHPNPVVCATLAGLTGVPLVKVLGVIGEARAISREEKAVWRKVALSACAALCAVGIGYNPTVARAETGMSEVGNVYYVINDTGLGAMLAANCLHWHALHQVRCPRSAIKTASGELSIAHFKTPGLQR